MLVRNLLYRAKVERSPIWLATALYAQNPVWTAQAPLLAMAIHPILNFLGWDFSDLEKGFFEEAIDYIPPAYLHAKTTALRAVVDAYTNPRPIDFGSNDAALLASAGLLYSDLSHVKLEGSTVRLHGYWATLPRELKAIPTMSFVEYTMGVNPQVRQLHPEFIYRKSLAAFQALQMDVHLPTYMEVPSGTGVFLAN